MIEVIPGINDSEFDEIVRKVELIVPYTEWAHIDFADNSITTTQTNLDFPRFSEFSENISLEAHLMVAYPEKIVKPLVDAGFKRLIAHVESNDPRLFLDEAQFESVEVGLAIDAGTDLEQIEPYLESVDVVLVMTVEIGPSGQPFLPETVEKIRSIRENFPDLPIAVDGGITEQTGRLAVESGATRLISTSYIFKDPGNIKLRIESLRKNVR